MTTVGGLAVALLAVFAVVGIGSILPVLPTGAAVSGTAVLAMHFNPFALLAVVAVGAAGAYAGDAVTYAICRAGGEALTRRLRMSRQPQQLAEAVQRKLERRPLGTLLVSRLVPGGRIPVLLTAAVLGLSWRRFATANVAACAVWATTYAAIGLLGRSVFPTPWHGVVAALVIALAATQLASWLKHRFRRDGAPDADRAPEAGRGAASDRVAEAGSGPEAGRAVKPGRVREGDRDAEAGPGPEGDRVAETG